MTVYHPYSIFPLGDSALVVDFGNVIDREINKKVIQLFRHLQQSAIPYITDLVPAYSSLTVYYDAFSARFHGEESESLFDVVAKAIETAGEKESLPDQEPRQRVKVPVCYSENFATDIFYLSQQKNISVEEIIRLHTSKTYTVYMIGFMPGFAYMGEVDEKISIPRKEEPVNVAPGSVGIAGRQTGVYPFHSPGGWQVIGRTPLKLFDKDKTEPTLFQTGNEVQFYSITEDEFANY